MDKKKIIRIAIIAVAVIAVLVLAFFAGGSGAEETDTGLPTETVGGENAAAADETENVPAEAVNVNITEENEAEPAETVKPEEEKTEPVSPSPTAAQDEEAEESSSNAGTKPQATPKPTATPAVSSTPMPTEAPSSTCTVSISCTTILDNMDKLKEGKEDLIPSDGWILYAEGVEFEEGESVFDIVQRVTRDYGIHFEYEFTPMYNSAYIEGIANIYEFDCGDNSGWMYRVNGDVPGYGVSGHFPEDGDMIEIVYTCSRGDDL